MGSAALAMDMEVTIILQMTGVYLALKGYADHVHASGFAPLVELLKLFFEEGGNLMVCSPCIQARKIDPKDLIPQASIIAGGTLISEISSASKVVTY